MEITAYTIVADNLPTVRERVEKINRRAAKLNVPGLVLSVVPNSEKFVEQDGQNFKTIDVTLQGESVKIAGWSFAATIQHTDEGNIVRRVPSGDHSINLNDYRTVAPNCDHCNQRRRRNDTYIVVNESGDTKQVGSSCLIDFLGVDPASVLRWMDLLIDLDAEMGSYSEPGTSAKSYFRTEQFVQWAVMAYKSFGWTSRKEASYGYKTATADIAMNWWVDFSKGRSKDQPTDEHIEFAAEAMNWVRSLDAENANDYIYNLYVACKNEWMTWRETGIVASLVQAYLKHLEREIERKIKAKSEWQGEIGKRQDFTLKVTRILVKDGYYGLSYITTLEDEDGNIFTWFASQELELGKTYTGKATVKDHTVWGDANIKQTVINRPKFELVEMVA